MTLCKESAFSLVAIFFKESAFNASILFKESRTANESVDYDALMRMVDYLLQNNADFLCVLGTTAETPTLTEEEKKTIKKIESLKTKE